MTDALFCLDAAVGSLDSICCVVINVAAYPLIDGFYLLVISLASLSDTFGQISEIVLRFQKTGDAFLLFDLFSWLFIV